MRLLQTVFSMIRICIGCYVLVELLYVAARLLFVATSRPGVVLMTGFIGRCVAVTAQTYLHGRLTVLRPLRRLLDSVDKYYSAGGCVRSMNKLPADDRRLDDACAVCLTSMDVDNCRLTPCGHAFHGRCLELCLRVSRYCPICRHQLLTAADR